MKLLLVLSFGLFLKTSAKGNVIEINRICRNGNNNTVFFKVNSLSNCNIIFPVALYGRENDFSTYFFIDSIYNFNSYNHLNANVPFNKNWSYFVKGIINCNDNNISYFSDTLLVDIVAPKLTKIDSVSVIPGTNTVIIGWQKNDDKDFSHFSIFNYNRADPRLEEVYRDLFYRDSLSGNVNTTQLTYEITTIDSCGNRAAFGNGSHSTIVLFANADTCKNQIELNWIGYKGWTKIKNYDLYKSINSNDFIKIASLNDIENSFTDFDVSQPNIYTYFLRAVKDTTILVTSSSNSITTNVGLRQKNKPASIKQVTVVDNRNIEISIIKDLTSKYGNIYLLKELGNKYVNVGSFGNTDKFVTNDDIKIINRYKVVSENVCNYPEDTSELSNNIVLTLKESNETNLTWNNYFTWNNGVKKYVIYKASGFNDNDATNFVEYVSSLDNNVSDVTSKEITSCYYVKAIENLGDGESKSNIVCNDFNQEVYFPNAINISSNNKFNFIGIGIDLNKTSIEIYNRYGQLIFNSVGLNNGWDGKNNTGIELPQDVYFFKANIVLINGKSIEKKGNITIIR
ncbi:MAG: gliding motility-associated C-terminal domain-containing protein [Bacteroidia bacterium]